MQMLFRNGSRQAQRHSGSNFQFQKQPNTTMQPDLPFSIAMVCSREAKYPWCCCSPFLSTSLTVLVCTVRMVERLAAFRLRASFLSGWFPAMLPSQHSKQIEHYNNHDCQGRYSLCVQLYFVVSVITFAALAHLSLLLGSAHLNNRAGYWCAQVTCSCNSQVNLARKWGQKQQKRGSMMHRKVPRSGLTCASIP